ncbi:exocyst complex component 1-like isoform X2 [Symsagittifera roscoffensis]|uniref:exocyst complex component 1-like isoform X2 n=1 Tax=Symsagittifera roscoffensis TaxID=84072 RepID=UPI00307BC7CA
MGLLANKDEVKRLLQNDLFSATNERLNAVISLPEESKKKRNVFLCVTASANNSGQTTGVKLVKAVVDDSKTSSSSTSATPFEIKRKEDILLSSVLNVNGRPTGSDSNAVGFTLSIKPRGGGGVGNMVQNTGDWISGTATNYTKMILTLDASAVTSGGGVGKPTQLSVTCASKEDRDYFLTVMHKMSLRYLPDNMKVQFINVEPGLLSGGNLNDSFDNNLTDPQTLVGDEHSMDLLMGGGGAGANGNSGDDNFNKELDDLQQVLMDSSVSCIDAEMLVSQLTQNLNLLDGENVSMIIGSEEKMLSLLSLFDASIEEIERLEESLEVYDRKLSSIRDYMNTMSSNEKLQKLESTNQRKLAKYLDEILNRTFFPREQEDILVRAFTSDGQDVETVETAAHKLISCLHVIESLDPSVREKVEAVKSYYAHLIIRQNQFLDNFRKALNAKFSENKRVKDPGASALNNSSSSGSTPGGSGAGLSLARRERFHQELNCFSDLTDILRDRDQHKFDYVLEQYASKCADQYRLDCEEFCDKVRFVLPSRVQGFPISQDKEAFYIVAPYVTQSFLGMDFGLQVNQMFGSMTNLAQSVSDATMAGAATLNPVRSSNKKGPVDLSQVGSHVIDVFRLSLDQLYAVYSAEDTFLGSFFGLHEAQTATSAEQRNNKDSVSNAGDDEDNSSNGGHDASFDGTSSVNSSFMLVTTSASNKQNLRRNMLKKLFRSFVDSLQVVIRECYMKNPVNILYIHTELLNRRHLYSSAHEMNDPLYSEIMIESLLASSESFFNSYFKSMEQMINDSKLVRPKKTGTLLFVSQLVEFSRATRDMFENCADSGAMFNKLHRLLHVLIGRLNQVQPDDRSPAEVIKLENFNVLQDFLRWIRVAEFADLTAETKKCYQENLSLYVDSYVGAPIQNLKALFDEIEDRLEDGLDLENVRFMQSLSVQEMKRQLSLATPKEVEKGIRALYLRVAKNLSSDGPESMTSVVWGAIQRQFLQNHARHNELLHLCYSPKLKTLYTVEMINEFFQRDS